MKKRKDLRKIDKYWRQRKLNVWLLTGVPEEENQSKGIEHMLKTSSRQLSWNKRSESIFERVCHIPENVNWKRPTLRYILGK